MINRNEEKWFLVEVNEEGEEYGLQKSWNGNGFLSTPVLANVHLFKTEAEAKNACKLQGMMNVMFGSNSKVYYMKESIERIRYDESGAVDETQSEEEGTPEA